MGHLLNRDKRKKNSVNSKNLKKIVCYSIKSGAVCGYTKQSAKLTLHGINGEYIYIYV